MSWGKMMSWLKKIFFKENIYAIEAREFRKHLIEKDQDNLRDYFAAHALVAIYDGSRSAFDASREAYICADSMLEAREKFRLDREKYIQEAHKNG